MDETQFIENAAAGPADIRRLSSGKDANCQTPYPAQIPSNGKLNRMSSVLDRRAEALRLIEEHGRRQSATEVDKLLDHGSNPDKNFIIKLLKDGKISTAIQVLSRMATLPEFKVFVEATLYATTEGSEFHVLHELARNGCCCILDKCFTSMTNEPSQNDRLKEIVNRSNVDGDTALHIAAECGQSDDVRILLAAGAKLRTNNDGWTQLHSAAALTRPNSEVARLLVAAVKDQTVLNALSNEGSNSALHIAADNPNMTRDFLDELATLDPTMRNRDGNTPFHVAATSSNADVIIAMLDVFAPVKSGWDIDEVDLGRTHQQGTLLEICMENCNEQAVSLLIQQGADLRSGLLHKIVEASVRAHIDVNGLIRVYHAVVDSAVIWWHRRQKQYIRKESKFYANHLRSIMMYLLTEQRIDNRNVIERAIELGAFEMLREILNTRGVFRFDTFGKMKNDIYRRQCSYIKYDISDMVNATMTNAQCTVSSLVMATLPDNKPRRRKGYVEQIISYPDEWRSNDILKTEPLMKLTKPLLGFAKRAYFCFGSVQLFFMGLLTAVYMPNKCTVMLFSNDTGYMYFGCNGNTTENATILPNNYRANPSGVWLIWPTIIFIYHTVMFMLDVFQELAYVVQKMKYKTLKKGNMLVRMKVRRGDRIITKLLLKFMNRLPYLGFSITAYVWFDTYAHGTDYRLYLQSISVLFLFGWMVNFMLFSGITMKLYMFYLVLREIIIKDIVQSFSMIFLFTVFGFSSAVHALRQLPRSLGSAAIGGTLGDTVYDMFTAALGVGDVSNISSDVDDRQLGIFLQLVNAVYICMTVVMLLNVLIAMLNNRYDAAKAKAESTWRHSSVAFTLWFQKLKVFDWLHRMKYNYVCCCFCCCEKIYRENGRFYIDVKKKTMRDC